MVPYAAGGGTDAIARVVAQGLTDKFGQQMIVENNGRRRQPGDPAGLEGGSRRLHRPAGQPGAPWSSIRTCSRTSRSIR